MELSRSQKLIYDMERYAGGSIAVICGSMLLPGKRDAGELQAAVNGLYRLNPALRTRIVGDGQAVDEYAEREIEVLRFADKAALERYAADYAQTPLDFHGELSEFHIVLLPGRYGLLVKLHHIVGDAWTLALIGSQFNALLNGEAPPAYPYADHLADETVYLESTRYTKDRAYFLEQFQKCPEVTYLSEKPSASFAAERQTFVIDAPDTAILTAYAKSHNVSVFVLFFTALASYMSRVKGNAERFYIGTAVLNRAGVREKNTAGMFVNTVPVLVELDNEASFADNLAAVKASLFGVFRHQRFNYGDALAAIRQEHGFAEKLYDVMLSYQNAAITGAEEESAWYHSGAQTESLQIHIDDRDSEGIFRIHYDYQTEKFSRCEIATLHDRLLALLFDAIAHDGRKLYELEMLTPEEKRKLLVDFNDTAADYPREKCVHQLFEEQAARTPEKTAVIACDKTLTYRELNKEANKIAHGLIDRGVRPSDIVAFMLPRRSCLIPAMFGILKAGAAYLPIDLDYPQERVDYILMDSGAAFFVTEDNIGELLADEDVSDPTVPVSGDNLCYCIYTSGTSGNPKGALIRHRNLVNFCADTERNNLQHYIAENCTTVLACGSIVFDISNFEIVLSLLLGKSVALANERELLYPATLGTMMSKNKVDCIHCTPTKLRIYLADASFSTAMAAVKCIMVGGELLTENVRTAIQQSGTAKIFNGYGPTETTMGVTFGESDLAIGRPIANTQIYIVDKYLNPVPIGVTGELCIAGDGVGAGYLNRPELTAEKFIENPFGSGKLYKTGDLAYWREDGNIVYVGRNDFQVKIRGLRIELGEIENALQGVEGVSQAVVVVRKDDAGRQLICAFYTGTEQDPKALRDAIGQKLPRYMLPHVFTYLDALPLTPSRKVNRKALPEIDLSQIGATVEYLAPATEQETALAAAVETVLGVERVGMLDNFFDLGGDSLKAIELSSRLEKAGYHTEVKAIFAADTLGELAAQLTAAHAEQEIVIPDGPIPATPAQLRVYTAQAMQGGTAYNVPYVFRAESVDPERLQAAVDAMVARYEILRTYFEERDCQIMQIEDKAAKCAVEKLKSDDISAFVRPFDLSKAPLLRVGYYENTVMIDLHHIITDGGSMPIFLRELNEFYMGRTPDTEAVQYRRFAVQPQDHSDSEKYWLSVFDEEPPTLDLNTDFKRGQKCSTAGSAVYDRFDPELHQKILTACRDLGVTPFVFYLGGFYVLLSKFSRNEDIVVGAPMSGRNGPYLDAIGMFVNTVALRGKLEGEKNVKAFLEEVRAMSVAAIAHQDYPYGELVKKLGLTAADHNPLFDVMFAYQSEEMTDVVFGDAPAELLPIPATTSKYDFTFTLLPREDGMVAMVEYCTDLYREGTIQRLLVGYKLVLTQMLDSAAALKEISALPTSELHTLLHDFNATAVEYPKERCVHQLFEEQAARMPDKTAVIACDKTLTYRELDEEANRIAHGLIEKGVEPGDIVAFMLPRRSYLIPAMFGILKAGAAYLPIDPDYPQERIDYMLKDSGAKMLLTEPEVSNFLRYDHCDNPHIYVDKMAKYCIIYTSGSTGKPKGCVLTHQGVCNFCVNNNVTGYYRRLGKEPIGASLNNVTFDYFIAENIVLLLNGFTTVLCDETQSVLPGAFWDLCARHGVNLIQTTPTKFRLMLELSKCTYMKNIDLLVTSGEPLTVELIRELRKYTDAKLFNPLGPSETTVWSPNGERIVGEDIHIGKPLANTQNYIVDKYLNPVPIGVTGELCIAGDGVGAGYLNRPDLTAEKFIENPFGPGKLYKTGDLAYWREDGNIVYVGRNDFQVKIRGLRIELGEIENALQGIEGVSQAVVVVRKDGTGRQLICAFYTGQEQDPKMLRTAIGQKLPKYMLPHIFAHLDTLPLTSSGKVNRKALPEVDMSQTVASEYVPPEGEIERRLAVLMEQVLNHSPVGRDDDFFDLGGDSLKAIEFVSKAHQDGIIFDLQSVFDHPTVRSLYVRIREKDQPHAAYTPEELEKYAPILRRNRLDPAFVPEKRSMGDVFLTGATGFLGSHILNRFLQKEKGKAYCLIRGEETRLWDTLKYYFGDRYAGDPRIVPIVGELGDLDKLDIPPVDMVIHAAASVKHYGSYPYFHKINVEGTEAAIRLARRQGSKLVHVSTVSVSGNAAADAFDGTRSETELHFSEQDLYIGQPLDNVYARSKFEAERTVLDAMLDGLEANIVRMGNLTSRASDGLFQPNYESNAFVKRVKAILELGCIPDYIAPHCMEFSPVDCAADAVLRIAEHFNQQATVFHVNSEKGLYFTDLLSMLKTLGIPMDVVDGSEFARRLQQSDSASAYEALINDLDETGRLTYDSNIRLENSFTVNYLHSLGFDWPVIELEYVRKFLEFFRNNGYWEV